MASFHSNLPSADTPEQDKERACKDADDMILQFIRTHKCVGCIRIHKPLVQFCDALCKASKTGKGLNWQHLFL